MKCNLDFKPKLNCHAQVHFIASPNVFSAAQFRFSPILTKVRYQSVRITLVLTVYIEQERALYEFCSTALHYNIFLVLIERFTLPHIPEGILFYFLVKGGLFHDGFSIQNIQHRTVRLPCAVHVLR
jgi:hypothetical protein